MPCWATGRPGHEDFAPGTQVSLRFYLPSSTLRVACSWYSLGTGWDAERPKRCSHAERGNKENNARDFCEFASPITSENESFSSARIQRGHRQPATRVWRLTRAILIRPFWTWCADLEERRAGRVRDRDCLRTGGDRHASRGRGPDLRGQGQAGGQPGHRACNGRPQARECVRNWPENAELLASHFWPGPLTLVLDRSPIIPGVVTAGRETVAVRSPRGAVGRPDRARAGQPVAAPSANRSNGISPTRAEHVLADLAGGIELLIDSGPTTIGLESTVLDLTGLVPRVLRAGPISRLELEAALGGGPVIEAAPGRPSRFP